VFVKKQKVAPCKILAVQTACHKQLFGTTNTKMAKKSGMTALSQDLPSFLPFSGSRRYSITLYGLKIAINVHFYILFTEKHL
jgi:hypothetical protein